MFVIVIVIHPTTYSDIVNSDYNLFKWYFINDLWLHMINMIKLMNKRGI